MPLPRSLRTSPRWRNRNARNHRRRPWPHRRTSPTVCHRVDWLFSDRCYADEPRFPHSALIGVVETYVERNRAVAREPRYYLIGKAGRENLRRRRPSHWASKTGFTGFSTSSFAMALTGSDQKRTPKRGHRQHMAMNPIRNPKDKHSLKVRRVRDPLPLTPPIKIN